MRFFRTTLVLAGAICAWLPAQALKVEQLKVQGMTNPLVVDAPEPTFSWIVTSDERAVKQTSYRIVVSADAEGTQEVWDSGVISGDNTVNVPSTGISLVPEHRYYWHVTVQDNKGDEAVSTEAAWFDTGLMGTGWDGARWIKASDLPLGSAIEPEEPVTDYYC